MGTTDTAIESVGSLATGFTAVIEGYEYILTDAGVTGPVLTAYEGTGWTSALTGLKVGGPIVRRMRPWANEIDVPTLTIAVQPTYEDTFGRDVFKSKPSFSSRLTATFAPDSDGSGTINIKDESAFGASGQVFIGGQRYQYNSTSAGALNVPASGSNLYSPFTGDAGAVYSPPQLVAENVNWDAAPAPTVSDVPPTWIGRRVAVYLHRIVGGVWDTRDQARLLFAGRITDIEDADNGDTVLSLEDLSACIRDAVILKRQWIGYVRPGIRLEAGTRFGAFIASDELDTEFTADDLVVVASGASGTNELDEGYYELTEFMSKLNAWLAAETGASRLEGHWGVSVRQDGEAGIRTVIAVTKSGGIGDRRAFVRCTSFRVMSFLGYEIPALWSYSYQNQSWWVIDRSGLEDGTIAITSTRPPYKIKFAQFSEGQGWERSLNGQGGVVEIETSEGEFYNQLGNLPPMGQGATGNWGIFQVGNMTILGRYDGSTISSMLQYTGPLRYLDNSDDPTNDGVTVDQEEDKLQVRQVLLLSGPFSFILTSLIASQGGEVGAQSSTYDVYPWGAKIPWSLLGENWVNSATALEHGTQSKTINTLVTQPTRLEDLIVNELALRLAWIVWKDGGYQLRTLPTPSSITADHALTEANKADPIGTQSSGRTTTKVTNEFLRNSVKIKYARDSNGKYRRTLSVVEQVSEAQYGGSRTFTIEATNSFGSEARVGAAVEELAASLVSRVFPVFSRPLKTLSRSIAPTLFHAAPGDTVSIEDDYARDPVSGRRGIDSRAGVITAVSVDYGHEGGSLYGEVEVLFVDEDRFYPMSPAAEIRVSDSDVYGSIEFTNGYADTAAGGPAIKLETHAYSRSGGYDPEDVTRFAAGDAIRIHQLDAGTQAWSREIVSVDTANSIIVLDSDLSGPTYSASATSRFRVQPDVYSATQTSQKLGAFQADDADGMIEDVAEPNVYGEGQWQRVGADTDLDELPMIPVAAESYGDGMPVHPGLIYDVGIMLNNLANYRTAPNAPMMLQTPALANLLLYYPVLTFPFYLGPAPASGKTRKLNIAPFMRTNNATYQATVRVTSSSRAPVRLSDGTMSWSGPTSSAEFTSSSTTWGEATLQSIIPVRGELIPGITWITIEGKIANATAQWQTRGLSTIYLGPEEYL